MMKLSDIGERKAVEIIKKMLKNDIGDDCAAVDIGKEYLLITTDMINQEKHIPKQAKPWQIGWFSIAVNLSDIAAKGGAPIGLVMALGLPRQTKIEFLEDMIRGMKACARKYGTDIIGGDTKECPSLTISGAAFGLVPKSRFMPRFGAMEGDLVAVTGNLGGAGAGYYSLKNGFKIRNAENALLQPEPRIYEGVALSKTKAVTSCMDISDGLASSLYQMTELGCRIDLSKIPIAPAAHIIEKSTGISAVEQALYFGGDYELVCTLRQEKAQAAVDAVEKIGGKLTIIGRVAGKRKYLLKDGKKIQLENRGYEHFR